LVHCLVYHTANTFWEPFLWSLLAFFLCSFARMHLGYNYPSDCILSLPIAYLTIGFAHLVTFLSVNLNISGCFRCPQLSPFFNICYSLNKEDIVDLNNYRTSSLNTTNTTIYAIVGTILFGCLTSYPIEFWRKTPYMLGNILAIYLFHSMLLCPNPKGLGELKSSDPNSWRSAIIYVFLAFQYFQIYVISNLLGRRTGHILSLILRTVVFVMICGQSLIAMIIYRLVKASANNII
jgi:hypothetical protein